MGITTYANENDSDAEHCFCDYCGKYGKVDSEKYAPEGWLFYFVRDDEESRSGTHTNTDGWITRVCSMTCAANIWCKGPGDTNHPPKTPRTEIEDNGALEIPEADTESEGEDEEEEDDEEEEEPVPESTR